MQQRTQVPTLAPADVASGDLNQDGHLDLIFANAHDGKTADVPSYVYWGSSTGFAPYMRTELQGFGGNSVNVADLNLDGNLDVVLVNRWSGMHAGQVWNNIYWGNPHHYYSIASRTALPGRGAYAVAVADLNDDGFNDLVLTNSYVGYSWIYWGSPDGYSPRSPAGTGRRQRPRGERGRPEPGRLPGAGLHPREWPEAGDHLLGRQRGVRRRPADLAPPEEPEVHQQPGGGPEPGRPSGSALSRKLVRHLPDLLGGTRTATRRSGAGTGSCRPATWSWPT